MKVEDLTIGSWVKVNDIEHTHPLQVAEIFKKCGAYYATLYWDGMPDNLQTVSEVETPSAHHVESIPILGIITQTEFIEKFKKEIMFLLD